ncbi:MAG: alanine--glyoxylate aminotransferase family protein [Anaerolineaceae bacterium]|nr:alanine--glyoxylate aminotransferase family protein [Anaerolineaceae bacterium]
MSPLFVPGPVDIHPDVLAALSRPMIYHRGKEFEELYHRTEKKARLLFDTKRHVYLSPFSGTGFMEAAMRNFVNRNVLVCVSGGFSDRWFQTAKTNGKEADLLEFTPGRPFLPEDILNAMKKKSYEAVAVVHSETSTGVENPIKEIAHEVREKYPDTLILADCVSSIGGTSIHFDDWQLDFAFGSVNKCLAMPPGLAIAAASARALKKAETVKNRGWFLDILRLESHHHTDTVPTTPPVSLYYALETQLDRIMEEGLENRFNRHAQLSKQIAAWGETHNMPPMAERLYRAKSITTLYNNHHLDFLKLRTYLKERDLEIANGYQELKDKTFRIANMGEIQKKDVDQLIDSLESFIRLYK